MRRLTAWTRAAAAEHLGALAHWLVFGVVVTLLWLALPVQARCASQSGAPGRAAASTVGSDFSTPRQKPNDDDTTCLEGDVRSSPQTG